MLGGSQARHRRCVRGPSFPEGQYREWDLGNGVCPSCLGAAGVGAQAATTEAQPCLLRQKAGLLACLPPCQLVTVPGGSSPSGQLSLEVASWLSEPPRSLCLWFPLDFLRTRGLICSVFSPSVIGGVALHLSACILKGNALIGSPCVKGYKPRPETCNTSQTSSHRVCPDPGPPQGQAESTSGVWLLGIGTPCLSPE